jgi:hypothetical protein
MFRTFVHAAFVYLIRSQNQILGRNCVGDNQGDVLDASTGILLTGVDFIFCCTDYHGSRYFLNQLAYQYFMPCIDMGVVINVADGKVTHFDGRVQMLAPGLVCGEATPAVQWLNALGRLKLNMYAAAKSRRDIHQGIKRETRNSSTQQVIDSWLSYPALSSGFRLRPAI